MLVAKYVGEFFALFEQGGEDLNILRISAIVVRQVDAAAEVGVGSELQDGSNVGRIAGERDSAVGRGLVAGDEIRGQAGEFGRIFDNYLQLGLLNVAAKLRRESGNVVAERPYLGARGFVFVDAGEAEFEQRATYVVLRGGVGFGDVHGRKRLIDGGV